MCMYRCEMVRTCMTIRNLKLYVWNEYFRIYALFGVNDICMLYDKVSIHTLIVFTTAWKLYNNELGFCKILKHEYECISNRKICNSIVRIRSRVTYCLYVMKYAHIVCNAWYALEIKNHIISKYFHSKAKIQPSP